jgi:hypothetical protein
VEYGIFISDDFRGGRHFTVKVNEFLLPFLFDISLSEFLHKIYDVDYGILKKTHDFLLFCLLKSKTLYPNVFWVAESKNKLYFQF